MRTTTNNPNTTTILIHNGYRLEQDNDYTVRLYKHGHKDSQECAFEQKLKEPLNRRQQERYINNYVKLQTLIQESEGTSGTDN